MDKQCQVLDKKDERLARPLRRLQKTKADDKLGARLNVDVCIIGAQVAIAKMRHGSISA